MTDREIANRIREWFKEHPGCKELNSMYEDFTLHTSHCVDIGALTKLIYKLNPLKYMTYIPDGMFFGFETLTNMVIPDHITKIKSNAFGGCSNLQSITIPDSVTSIDDWAFHRCSDLTSVYITDIAKWCGISFSISDANPLIHARNLYLNGNLVDDIKIPDGVPEIKPIVFLGYKSLTSVTISDSVTSIGKAAFSGCAGLNRVTIGDGMMSIGEYAFCNCSSLTSIDYTGTIAEWKNISKATNWARTSSITQIKCSDGTLNLYFA